MRSLRLGKIFGITAELHWSFLFIVLLIFLSFAVQELESAISTGIFFFFLFLSVFLHELVHSVVSLSRGIKVRKIILLPIGGIALTEEMPEKASDEFLIAVSGPLFNFLVVIAVWLLVSLFPLPFPWELFSGAFTMEELDTAFLNPLFAIFYVNLILGAFNLFLPALPLDGGRVLRSLLSMRIGHLKATRFVTTISSFISIMLFLIGFFAANPILIIIAFFILFGAKEEAHLVELKHVFRQLKTAELVEKDPLILEANIPVGIAIEELFARRKLACLVDFGNNRYGVFDLSDIPQKIIPNEPLGKYAKQIEPIDISMPADKVLERFITRNVSILPVFENGVLIGAISIGAIERAHRFLKCEQAVSSAISGEIKKQFG
ncbi:MAG: M50 family metallopeptidase [Candidatus Diapherotrites archaeon]|nr:M50 family metallopeptidase [Candidatus Diapherotrites archaeon]